MSSFHCLIGAAAVVMLLGHSAYGMERSHAAAEVVRYMEKQRPCVYWVYPSRTVPPEVARLYAVEPDRDYMVQYSVHQ